MLLKIPWPITNWRETLPVISKNANMNLATQIISKSLIRSKRPQTSYATKPILNRFSLSNVYTVLPLFHNRVTSSN